MLSHSRAERAEPHFPMQHAGTAPELCQAPAPEPGSIQGANSNAGINSLSALMDVLDQGYARENKTNFLNAV